MNNILSKIVFIIILGIIFCLKLYYCSLPISNEHCLSVTESCHMITTIVLFIMRVVKIQLNNNVYIASTAIAKLIMISVLSLFYSVDYGIQFYYHILT